MDCPPNCLGIFALGKGLIHRPSAQSWDMKVGCPRPGIGSAKGMLHAIPEVSESHGITISDDLDLLLAHLTHAKSRA